MNVHVRKSFDVDAYCKRGAARHALLMNPPASKKPPLVSAPTKSVNLANGLPAWRRGHGISFDAHIDAYRKSSRFAQGPNVYIRRRVIEMGFNPVDALGDARFRPIIMLRALLFWELQERFHLTIRAIAQLLETDDTAGYNAKSNPRPDPVDVCVCGITPMGMSYFDGIEKEYRAGVNLHATADRYRLSHTSIHKIAKRMGWPLRQCNKGGRKPL